MLIDNYLAIYCTVRTKTNFHPTFPHKSYYSQPKAVITKHRIHNIFGQTIAVFTTTTTTTTIF